MNKINGPLINEEAVLQIVADCPRQRYKVIDGEDPLIRANTGHSIANVCAIKMKRIFEPKPVLYGTSETKWCEMQVSGISRIKNKKSRNNVNFIHMTTPADRGTTTTDLV